MVCLTPFKRFTKGYLFHADFFAQVDGKTAESPTLRERIPQFQVSEITATLEDSLSRVPGHLQDLSLPPAPFFFYSVGRKSQKRKQKASELQKNRRQKRRAGIKSGRENPDGSSEWDTFLSTDDELSRNPEWYWSFPLGWRRVKVLLEENGRSKWAYHLSSQGGYLRRDITGPEFKPATIYYGPVPGFLPVSPIQFATGPAQVGTEESPGEC
jgi:hypothetical protein